ncbi:MAG: hypothetical protein K1000chlam1_00779, partial [Candidatus Anoxychlamydiales bacterium]|nr:hypothetical protein [Candidatus Anoxychlamydiales bacterium]
MKKMLSILLEEFKENLPDTYDSVERKIQFSNIPKMINVAIGMRRSGKTYLIYQKIRELISQGISLDQILFINFEDDRLLPMKQKELSELLENFYTLYPQNHDKKCYFFLDEIQNVDGWPLVIRRFYDSKKVQIFLTGSSAKLLSKEIATSLRGRSISTEVWPYSFQEYCEAHNIKRPKPPIGKKIIDQFNMHFNNYFSIGGFPAIQHLHENERRTILQGYINTVIFRDIIERYKITNTVLIKYLIKTLIKNVAQPFAVHKFYNDIKSQGYKISKDTIYQYMEYIEDAFLIFSVPIFSESLRKTQLNPKRIYVNDNGLVCANRLSISQQLGSLFENQIYLDLRRQNKKVKYYITQDGYEIDFVVEN